MSNPKPRYLAGYATELRAKTQLLKQGATLVVRSSRSLTPADLIAIFPSQREIWLIQCKKQEAPKNPTTLTQKYRELKQLEGTYQLKTYLYMKRRGKYQFIPL